MKAFSIHPASCSCTSCVYRSRSKEPKVQQIIQGGTEIDKLYYGKFLPLRERKLLEKLIRTRDVYDDVRNQLLSSASSDQISLEHKRKRRDDASTDKSSAVFKMVDLVDRGQMGSANTSKLNSCCSCCSCETLRKIRKRMQKDKHHRIHRHIVTCEDIAKYCAEAEERGRKRRNKLSTKISSKMGATRLKMKKHLSEPCACTLSLSSMATRSKKALKKIRSKKKATESTQARKVVTIDQETKIAKLPRRPRKTLKNIQSSTTKDSGTELRSLKAFKIKKDSIILFKEKLLKKRTYEENQDVECEPGTCNTEECVPEECLRKIKAKGVGDTRKRKYRTRHSETKRDRSHISMISRTKKVKVRDSQVQDGSSPKSSHPITTILKNKVTASFSKSEIKGKRPVSPKQRQKFEKGTGKQEKAHKRTKSTASMTSIPKLKAKTQLTIKEEKATHKVKPRAKLQVVAKDKRLEKKGIRVQVPPQSNLATCECKPSTKSTSSLTSVPKQKASKSRFKRIKSHEVASPPTRQKKGRQKPRRESFQTEEADLEEPIEHVKAKRENRMKPTIGRIKQRRKHKHSNTQFTGTLSKASQESYFRESASQANDLPFPRECEPLMCIPYECDPEKCAEILLSRSKSRGKSAMTSMDPLRRKSVGSAAFSQKTSSRSRTKSKHKQSKSTENFIRKPKYVSKEPPPQIVEKCSYPDRQAVKITSSFSFDIEFYKDTYPCVKDDEKKDLVSGHQKKIKQKEHRRKNMDHGTRYISFRENISSQSRSSQSFKNIQMGHRLKRCFCTLKLLPKKKQKLKHAVSKRTMGSFKPSGIAYVVPPATSTQASLLPYECEPYFCTPGDCNPYECAEIIKQRSRRAASHVSPKKSKLASTSQSVSKSTSRPVQSCDCHPQSSNIECECKVSGDKSERHENRNKVYKPHVRHETSETNKYAKTKQTYTEPFLQRCLCTLKLLKKNKKKVETLSPWQNRNEYVMHMQNKSVTTNRAEIRYNHKRSKLLPYEWEPGLCIPKECDPYNCEKLIKLRHMLLQHKYSSSGDLGSRSTFIKTSKTVKLKKRNEDYNEINIMPSRSKQRVMRVGSKSNLKIWRYKSKDNFITTEDLLNKHTHNKVKLNTIGSQQFKRPAHHTSIDEEAKLKEKGSFVFSAIKRYFNAFKFQKKINREGLENKNNLIRESIKTSYPLPNSQICDYKSIRTRLSKLPYSLSSYKCAPNFCMPRMCDPYECYDESKRRDTKGLHNLYVSTNRLERKSVVSVTSDFSGSTMAKSTKSGLLKHKRKKHQKVRDNQRDVKAARSFSPSRHAARKGANNSFNKEILKYRFMSSSFIGDTTVKNRVEKYKRVSEISTVSRMTDKDTKNKRAAVKDDLSQAKEIRKEAKPSNVVFLLKRCFQKKNKPKPEFRWHQPITTQFVQVEQNRHDITRSGCKILNKTYGGETLKLKLPEDLLRNQSAKYLPKSCSFSRRPHVRSRIEFNLDKMRWLLNTQKINPFYRSFYALNVKVSKSKNIPDNKYRALDDKERRPSECPPNECDADECSKRVKRLKRSSKISDTTSKRLKRSSKVSDTTSMDSQFSCYKKCLAEFKKQKKKGRDKAVTLGSDLSIKAGVYKDTDPYKSSRCQALRVGSDVRLNFEFFKEPSSRGFCRTGPISYHDRKKARRSHPQPADIQAYGETQSKGTGISHKIQRCFCAAKLKNATKSDINQNRDVTRTAKDNPRYKSTTRLSLRKEKRERSFKTKSVQYKDYSQQQRKKSQRPTDRNNVTFCTNVNCVEFYNDRTQKNTKLNRVQRRGEGDVGKQKGPIAEITTVPKIEKEDNKKKLNKFIDKCYCTLKNLKGQKHGKHLTPKQSMEMIGKEKICKYLDEAEREMETIMPYSKKKFKKLDSQSILAQSANQNTKQNQQGVCETCKIVCQPFMVDLEKKKSVGKEEKEKKEKKGKKEKKRGKEEPKRPAVDNKPLFEMTVNKANMKIVNRDEVLKNLGSSGKESKAMKKARAASKKGNVDAPVMTVIIDRGNATIINSNQVMDQINQPNKHKGKSIKAEKKTKAPEPASTSQTKKSVKKERRAAAKSHGSKCKCCICRGLKKGKKAKKPPEALTQKLRPCVCGSVLCKKDWNRIYHEQRSRAAVKLKKCVCGSNICEEESSKMPELLLEGARQAEREKEMARRAILKEKLYQKAKKKRAKERKKALKKENKMRKKQDKREMKSVKKSENQGDISLIAESLIDLGTFGSKAFCDIARSMFRAVGHPRDAWSDARETVKDPAGVAQALQARAEGLGLFSTLSRIKQRMLKMPAAKAAVTTLEAIPVTNYLVHMADKDPKKRMKKFKTKRTREPLNFQCSLYMASMRKRPCLRVYYMCPWFYPHCMSLLNTWKQFMDILLFVLAVLVWSPCILCMELCRGCVCCCMCQG